jgi:sugar lactone lactonase YvrE
VAGSRRIAGWALGALAALATLAAPAAHAVPDCPDRPTARSLLAGQGVLESVIVDERGRLFYSDTTRKAFLRIDAPGAEPVVLAADVEQPGGLAFAPDGALIAGQGNGFVNGALGNASPRAALLRIDPDTGERSTYATGVSMGNGLAAAPDGTIFASDDAGLDLDRIPPGGGVAERGWARVVSANGLAVDDAGEYLYAAQTFQPAAIQRVEIANPANVETFARPGPDDVAAGLDGMTRGDDGRLYVAANGAGEVWRVATDGALCALARGLRFPSAVAVGRGDAGFADGNVYAVTFAGDLVELRGAAR